MRVLFCALLSLPFLSVFGQLRNTSFRFSPGIPQTKHGFSFEGLQYLKNNEYFNGINPGETLFGFRGTALYHFRINDNARIVAGGLLQKDFGDPEFLSQAFPLLNFELKKKTWLFNLGSVEPHIFHDLVEPLLNYENIISQPVEYGFQAKRSNITNRFFYDAWLNWRQKADGENGLQEQIIFGQSMNYHWLKTGHFAITNPIQAVVYHQGGQALNLAAHIRTTVNATSGIRALYFKDSFSIFWEGYALGSLDNSPTPSQPYKNGWALFSTLNFKIKYHELALSWWYAREFTSAIGSPVFNNVNLRNPYQNQNTRRLAMLRYVYSRPIFASNLWIDFRLEPYYDFERKGLEFSQSLYFRFVGITDIKLSKL